MRLSNELLGDLRGAQNGRQILGDFAGTKMAITSLKIKILKKFKKFWLSQNKLFDLVTLNTGY